MNLSFEVDSSNMPLSSQVKLNVTKSMAGRRLGVDFSFKLGSCFCTAATRWSNV